VIEGMMMIIKDLESDHVWQIELCGMVGMKENNA
jgi:hypothetical protein